MNDFLWLLRREVWEHRVFYIAPIVLVSVVIVIYVWGIASNNVSMGVELHDQSLGELMRQSPGIASMIFGIVPFMVPTVLLNIALLFIWFFYLTGSLYNDRKDRSVLFWKSLPIGDSPTVLSKLVTAMFVLPLIAFAGIVVAATVLTLVNVVFVLIQGLNPWDLVLSRAPLLSAPILLVYSFAVQSLWYAPLFGWLLLTSAWAPRAPALWALLPPVAVVVLEQMLFSTERFGLLIAKRLQGVVPTAFRDEDFDDRFHSGEWPRIGELIDPASFLSDPGLWGGLVIAAVFIAGAIWARRYRETG